MADQQKRYRCATCNAEFNTQEELDKHARMHAQGSPREGDEKRKKEERAPNM